MSSKKEKKVKCWSHLGRTGALVIVALLSYGASNQVVALTSPVTFADCTSPGTDCCNPQCKIYIDRCCLPNEGVCKLNRNTDPDKPVTQFELGRFAECRYSSMRRVTLTPTAAEEANCVANGGEVVKGYTTTAPEGNVAEGSIITVKGLCPGPWCGKTQTCAPLPAPYAPY